MEEMELQEKPGLIERLHGWLVRDDEAVEEETEGRKARNYEMRPAYKYHVTVRRQIVSFDDALASAQGFKRGEQQVLNLSATEPGLRQKIVDFMSGVNFAQEGTWEEIGEHIYLVVPANVFVEVAPGTPRASAMRN